MRKFGNNLLNYVVELPMLDCFKKVLQLASPDCQSDNQYNTIMSIMHRLKHYTINIMMISHSLTWPDLFPFVFRREKRSGYLTIEFLCCRIQGYCGVLIINDKLKRKC